jgi:outer membrane lipoprotein-sorting protein
MKMIGTTDLPRHVSVSLRILRWGASCLLALCGSGAAESVPDAREIVRLSDDLHRREQSYATITMVITRPDWTRTLEMEGWTQGTSNSFMRVLKPKKEKDVTFLKKGREAWQYVPSVDRVIKIPPSMMLQSWMGSDLTNDDIVRADSLVVDYDHRIAEETEENGTGYWIVESIPKENAPVVWDKVVLKVRRTSYLADRIDYYDEDGVLVKYYLTSDIKNIEGLELATKFIMYDKTREGYSTTLTYDKLTFRPEIKKGTFTVRNLRR